MRAIFKREFAAYMHSMTGWLFMAVTICLFAMYASVYNMSYGSPYVAYALDSILILFFITVPVLSMRVMAEERKQKTDQLLLTSPVSVGKIVLGKYLAMAAVFAIPSVLFCIFPLLLSRYGTVPIAESFVALLAFILYGLTAIAVGMFISSLTENQVIAAVISFLVLFATYMMQGIESLISSTGNIVTRFLEAFDFYSHYSDMINTASDITGTSRLTTVFDITSVIYFVSVTALMLFLTTQTVQKRRYTVSVKNVSADNMKMGAYSSVTVVIAIALTVIVNILAEKLPTEYTSIDVSSNKLYELTEQTKQIVGAVDEEVNIYVLADEDSSDGVLKQTLDRYAQLSDKIKVSYIDPLLNPRFAADYTSDVTITQNSVIVETDKRSKVIPYTDMYEIETDYSTYQQSVTGYDAEGQLTSAISYCTSDDMPKIYFLAGHNEYTFDSGFNAAIEKENIDYETISLMECDKIPDDATCVIIDAPETDFSSDDADKVIEYLNNGGKAVVITEYVTNEQPNFKRILSEFGLDIGEGCIADNNTGNYYQAPIFLLPDIGYADETSGLTGEYSYIMAPYAQAVIVPEEAPENVSYTKLLTTSENSVLKTADKEITTFEKEEGEAEGPFCVGVKAEKTLDNSSAVLYVFSSAQMFTDQYDSYVAGSNKQLFSNIMGSVANHEVSVSIPAKSYEMEWLTINAFDAYVFKAVGMIMVPAILVAAGLVIWLKRRKL